MNKGKKLMISTITLSIIASIVLIALFVLLIYMSNGFESAIIKDKTIMEFLRWSYHSDSSIAISMAVLGILELILFPAAIVLYVNLKIHNEFENKVE